MDDPQGTFIKMMNSMLPLEGNGFTMMKLSGELSKRDYAHTMGRPGLLSRENSGVIPKGVKGTQFVEGFVVEWD